MNYNFVSAWDRKKKKIHMFSQKEKQTRKMKFRSNSDE